MTVHVTLTKRVLDSTLAIIRFKDCPFALRHIQINLDENHVLPARMSKLLIKHASFLVIWEKLHGCPYTRDFVAAAFANLSRFCFNILRIFFFIYCILVQK